MRALQLAELSGPGGVRWVEVADPEPGPGEVVVRVGACSLNHRDLMVADGRYGRVELPLVPLSDGAGEVAATGPGVARWKAGDRVTATFFAGWPSGPFRRQVLHAARGGAIPGMAAERVVVREADLVPTPAHLTDVEAATLPCAAVTAWNALVVRGALRAGQTVLVLGTGGVSVVALQIAVLHGARVIVVSSSVEKLERARAMGAAWTIHRGDFPDWEKEVVRVTEGAGADHVVEVGGRDTFPRSLRCVAAEGIVSLIGGLSGATVEVALRDIFTRTARVQGVFVGSREVAEALHRALEAHPGVRPAVDRVFPAAEARAAYEHLASGVHFGKVVVSLGGA